MINDFMQEVSDRIELKFKDMFIIADNGDRGILTDDGEFLSLPASMIDFGMKFKYSTWSEWLQEIHSAPKNNLAHVFPFMYVNALGVTEGNGSRESDAVTTFPNIIFAVPTPAKTDGHDTKTVDRDAASFRPLLNNFYNLFYDALKVNTAFSIVDRGERVNHYFYGAYSLNGGEGNKFPEMVDCIEIKNLKLRIYKC